MTAAERQRMLDELDRLSSRVDAFEALLEGEDHDGDVLRLVVPSVPVAARDYLDVHQGSRLFRVFYAAEQVGNHPEPTFEHWAYWWELHPGDDGLPDQVEGQTGVHPSQGDAACEAVRLIFQSVARG